MRRARRSYWTIVTLLVVFVQIVAPTILLAKTEPPLHTLVPAPPADPPLLAPPPPLPGPATETFPETPSLVVTVDVTPTPVVLGIPVTATLTLTNRAPYPAHDVVVTLPLPPGVAAAPAPALSPTGWRWALGELAAEAVHTVTLQLTLTTPPPDDALVLTPQVTARDLPTPATTIGGALVDVWSADSPQRTADSPESVPTVAPELPSEPLPPTSPAPSTEPPDQAAPDPSASPTSTAIPSAPPGTPQPAEQGLADAAATPGPGDLAPQPRRIREVQFTPGTEAVLRGPRNRVQVRFPGNGFGRPLRLTVRPRDVVEPELRAAGQPVPPLHANGRLSFAPFFLDAIDQQGRGVHRFDAPLTLQLQYTDAQLQVLDITPSQLTVFWFDADVRTVRPDGQEQRGAWMPLPTTVDVASRTVTATVDHFSAFTIGNGLSASASFIPSLQGWQVSAFTGGATYSYPLEVPSGPGGLKPVVNLAYASNAQDGPGGARKHAQASWVGRGWSLDPGGAIARNKHSCCGNWDHFTLTAMGHSFDIVRGNHVNGASSDVGSDHQNLSRWRWHVADEAFWRITANADNTWTAWSPDGVRYAFTQPLQWGWAGPPESYEPYKWLLTEVRDPSGNRITFHYLVDSIPVGTTSIQPTYQLNEIKWAYDGGIPGTGTPRYRLFFETKSRWAAPTGGVDLAWEGAAGQIYGGPSGIGVPYEAYRLDKLWLYTTVPYYPEQPVARWDFSYADAANSVSTDLIGGQKMLTLTRVARGGYNPAIQQWGFLPATTLTYQRDRTSDQGNVPPNPGWNRLVTAENGYGGRVRFAYEPVWTPPFPDATTYYETSPYANRFRVRDQFQEPWPAQSYSTGTRTRYSYSDPALNTHEQSAVLWYAQYTPVANQYGTWDGMGDSRQYLAHAEKTEFRGHATVEAAVSSVTSTGEVLLQRRQQWFYQGRQLPTACTPQLLPGANNQSYVNTNDACYQAMVNHEAWRGRVYREDVLSSAGSVLQRTATAYTRVELPFYQSTSTRDYRRAGLWRAFTATSAVDTTLVDGNNTSTKRTEYFYNAPSGAHPNDGANNCASGQPLEAYGRLTCVREVERGAPVRRTTYAYATRDHAGGDYLVDRQTRSSVLDEQGRYLAHTLRYYDYNNASVGVTDSRGLLSRELALWSLLDSNGLPQTLAQLTGRRVVGRDTLFSYDSWGNQTTATTYSGGGWVEWTGDSWWTSAPGDGSTARTTTTEYDAWYHAFPVAVTNPLHQVERAEYDFRLGTLTRVTDANGQQTVAAYDPFARLILIRKPGDWGPYPTVSAAYYDYEQPFRYVVQELEQTHSDNARVTVQLYDGLGRQIQTKREASSGALIRHSVTDLRSDGLGRVTQQSQPRYVEGTSQFYQYVPTPGSGLRWTTTQYDALGRQVQVTMPDNSVTRTYYGVFSNGTRWHTVIDARRQRTEMRRDALDRVVGVVEYSGSCGGFDAYSCGPGLTPWDVLGTTTYSYSALDGLIQVTDAQQNVTTLQYDSLGRKVRTTEPNMGTWRYNYDTNGNLTSQTDARGHTLSFSYDALQRLTGVSGPSVSASSFTYDETDHGAGVGRRTSMRNAAGSSQWWYDGRGRVTQATHTVEGHARTFTWAYDSADRVTQVHYPTNESLGIETVTYGYDGGWRQQWVCTSFGGCYGGEATYSAVDQPEVVVFGNGLRQTWEYVNPQARLSRTLVGLSNAPDYFFARAYTYDANGNVLTLTNQKTGQQQQFSYDARDRLASWGGSGILDEGYQYDRIGNLTRRATSQWATAYSYGANGTGTNTAGPHQARSIGGASYSYDANGNLTSAPGRSYQWNGFNQPTAISGSGILDESYQYNADGARVRVSTSAWSRLFLEGLWEEEVGGAVKTYYTLNGTPVAVRTTKGNSSTVAFLHGDHLGSVSLTTRMGQEILSQQEYDPWGKVRSGGVTETQWNYTSQYLDGTGLLYYKARYYDPAIGRFISADTIVPGSNPLTVWPSSPTAQGAWGTSGSGPANPQNLNRYSYALNNPLKYTDPTGHHPCIALLAGGPVGAGTAAFCAIFLAGVAAVGHVAGQAVQQAVEEGHGPKLPPASSDTGGQTASPQPPKDPNHVKGDYGEEVVAKHLGLQRNTQKFSLQGKGYQVKPDFVSFEKGFIAEVKNHERVAMTAQLRGMLQLARERGVRFDLYVNKNSQIVGKELQRLIDSGDINIIRLIE